VNFRPKGSVKPPGVVPRVQLADNLSVSKVRRPVTPCNSLCCWPMPMLLSKQKSHTSQHAYHVITAAVSLR
jgi:hypothetical protein